ncbi:class I SAM-dependent methyltransferase [Treponema sp. OMZ 792]|uniref:class I SAM-dependent methyltransferase n=1 Tax=unclassified Treponema TaxID=2638727 RepID=UPI0020A60AF2|nr:MULTISPECIES: class I SAM-dependent methyltransferase [unclassified Treponema]UTC74555.1 class I SAM-dependent methyltransferase [Treponema sp. OMZ 792]UTC80950.1 class I SAM-dependent methyltransferase [Treponema sp. OMZ 798]
MCKENYYAKSLNSQKLFQVYETAIPRVKQYLDEEINFIKKKLTGNESVLEIGCGYGRILKKLYPYAKAVTGIDISEDSIKFAKEFLKDGSNIYLETMDAYKMNFKEEFDMVLCLQNGLSAIKGEPEELIQKCIKALKKNGRAYFSTYSSKFWNIRLDWFKEQADKKLLGEIDEEKTKDGIIICKDGFKARTFTEKDFDDLGKKSGLEYEIKEIDESSLFLIIKT